MKLLRLIIVFLGAVCLLRLAACTTGFFPSSHEQNFRIYHVPEDNKPEYEEQSRDAVDSEQVRDAIISYLVTKFPDQIEQIEIFEYNWKKDIAYHDGRSENWTTIFTNGNWQINIYSQDLDEINRMYHVIVRNTKTDFTWSGYLNSDLKPIHLDNTPTK